MTCGNGHDTHFLSNLGAQVIGFDIQEKAIEATKLLVPSAKLYHQSHKALRSIDLAAPPALIVYNLGYLPGGDKTIVTRKESTIESLKKAVELSKAISIMCYPGHEEGAEEEAEVLNFVRTLSHREWNVLFHQWPNRLKGPSLFWLTRL
jgi:hypothetical protein